MKSIDHTIIEMHHSIFNHVKVYIEENELENNLMIAITALLMTYATGMKTMGFSKEKCKKNTILAIEIIYNELNERK